MCQRLVRLKRDRAPGVALGAGFSWARARGVAWRLAQGRRCRYSASHARLPNFIELPGPGPGIGHPAPAKTCPMVSPDRESVFDTCQVGVVLRAVLFVEAIVWVAALFGAASLWSGWARWPCSPARPCLRCWRGCWRFARLKRLLARWPMAAQWAVGVSLGALAACMAAACWPGWVWPVPNRGGGQRRSGALVAAILVTALVWRARPAHRPAPQRAWPSCRRAFGPTFCSTRSTAPSRWCGPSRPRPRACWKT